MNVQNDIIAAQVDALVKALDDQQQTSCREIRSQSESRAQAMLAECRRHARDRVRQAINEERRRRKVALHQAAQQIQTAERNRIQTQYNEMLQRAWPQLVNALQARWSNDTRRDQWCELIVDEARNVLSPGIWVVEHPALWSTADDARLIRRLAAAGVTEPDCCTDKTIQAGLRIRHAGACLDGTIDGLLARKTGVAAQLLAAWDRDSMATGDSSHA